MKRNHKNIGAITIKGLVLIGGKSTRMGTDKSQLDYHGKPQKEFVKELLEANGIETFYSVSKDEGNSKEISDVFSNVGPLGGICSAFQKDSHSAWFVLATDLPFVNDSLIKLVLEKRNPSKMATTVKGMNKDSLEPLIAIYEPTIYPVLKQSLEEGNFSPLKILTNLEVEIVEVEDEWIENVNTLEEVEVAKEKLGKKKENIYEKN